jgi:hypothetical protein
MKKSHMDRGMTAIKAYKRLPHVDISSSAKCLAVALDIMWLQYQHSGEQNGSREM